MATGCALFDRVEGERKPQLTWKQAFGTDGPEFVDATRPQLETIILEIGHVEQPLSDMSLIDLLWKEVDQIGSLEIETRRELEDNGIRVGVTGPNPPRILQSMMEVDLLWRRKRYETERVPDHLQRVSIMPGTSMPILVSDGYASCRVEVPRGSKREERTYENAKCVFRVEAEKIQEGWVKLEFIPEIHYGANGLRRVASEDGWQFSDSQRIETLYSQRFTLTLNRGELAVMTATHCDPGRLGYAFFVGDGEGDEFQRMLTVRLLDVVPAREKHTRER